MSALRCKEIIDSAAALIGQLSCLIGAVALNGAQGREPTEDQATEFRRAQRQAWKLAGEMIEEVQE